MDLTILSSASSLSFVASIRSNENTSYNEKNGHDPSPDPRMLDRRESQTSEKQRSSRLGLGRPLFRPNVASDPLGQTGALQPRAKYSKIRNTDGFNDSFIRIEPFFCGIDTEKG